MDAPGGGKTGLLQEQDVKGNILWEFKDEMLHHDFDVDLNTDTVYALKFTMLSKEFSNKIIGGKPSLDEASWSDTIIQIDHSGKIIWSWNLGDHLDPRDYVLDSITPRKEWSHSNSIKFYTTNPINHKPSLLLSSRHLNTVFLIDRETGKILWSSPKGTFSYQHDATLTKDGTVLVFDNGLTREQERPFLWSRLVEINPLTNKIVWQFRGGSTGPEMGAFAASIMSGAQRLPNGNTLGIDALSGHIFEVTKDGVVVFSFINPYQALDSTGPFGNNVIFKARKISNDYFTKKFLR
jgi:outer membrane protein assembly factor BamB